MTLLHYIALTVKEKYPELANFFNELHFVDKAAAGVQTDRIRQQQRYGERGGTLYRSVLQQHAPESCSRIRNVNSY